MNRWGSRSREVIKMVNIWIVGSVVCCAVGIILNIVSKNWSAMMWAICTLLWAINSSVLEGEVCRLRESMNMFRHDALPGFVETDGLGEIKKPPRRDD